MPTDLIGSVARIADFPDQPYRLEPRPRNQWKSGDYVGGRVDHRPSPQARLEAPSGRTIEPLKGERVIGALGIRKATREIVGSWKNIGEDGSMQVIGGGGIIGRVTSVSPFLPEPISLNYSGHVIVDDHPVNMVDHVEFIEHVPLEKPVILVTGTSMSAGKTTAARVLIRLLKESGYSVAAAKLAGPVGTTTCWL